MTKQSSIKKQLERAGFKVSKDKVLCDRLTAEKNGSGFSVVFVERGHIIVAGNMQTSYTQDLVQLIIDSTS